MPDDAPETVARLASSIAAVPAAEWDACAGSANPFVSHAFLEALEASGSVGGQTGWRPAHLLLESASGRLIGAVPLYLKSHSWGEYVFDQGWAEAWERAGGRYYPKLQAAVPFTPVPGPRLLAGAGADAPAIRAVLARALIAAAEQIGVSSLHVTFATREDIAALGAAGFLIRTGMQFHWENRGYSSFDDFLAALASRKRKAIRKERAAVGEAGVSLRALTGPEITGKHWDSFFRFYTSTSDRKWGSPYLTRAFFDLLGAAMGDKVVLIMAERNGRPIAGALNLKGADTLYGRNWGCSADVAFLHFEACYYQAIDYAIAHGLARVEAGAQGEHKIQRGYLPVETWSAHWIADAALRKAVADFLKREHAAMEREMAALVELSPYRERAYTRRP
ncbi:MAG TPA: GNAT family N-acetyltransferase [Alphaproteobacteria bacterium]|nr:GNAT family N-acetyltransferase [Alphaproteobacteria bacterium]